MCSELTERDLVRFHLVGDRRWGDMLRALHECRVRGLLELEEFK